MQNGWEGLLFWLTSQVSWQVGLVHRHHCRLGLPSVVVVVVNIKVGRPLSVDVYVT